ncbi:LytR C-terminal domain-containing protein [Leucobacter salsicius]|uniref:LytR C-terminal domain-containing protein n=1 Tax=Leucobacter salsicius TaxID=664638 RepID=UPI00034640E4|nr:LytR C-terminal domain-containing protein [Leucobacter salsicius]
MGQNSAGSGERQRYPEDRFDRVARTGRVGAHRVTARPRYVWQFLIAGLLGFALLTTVGVLVVHNIGAAGKLPSLDRTPATTAPAKPEAKLDPTATVAVLNGSETPNLAASLDKLITDEQWGQILFSGSAASQDVKISAVFYSDPADADAAAGLAAKLGGLSTYTTQDYVEYGAKLVVLLGSDYAGPGLEEAASLTAERGAEGTIAPEGAADAGGAVPETPEGQ